jgi:5-methylcytosine-specific restriction endonuclease McrA
MVHRCTTYECVRCGKQFDKRDHYDRHAKRVRLCGPTGVAGVVPTVSNPKITVVKNLNGVERTIDVTMENTTNRTVEINNSVNTDNSVHTDNSTTHIHHHHVNVVSFGNEDITPAMVTNLLNTTTSISPVNTASNNNPPPEEGSAAPRTRRSLPAAVRAAVWNTWNGRDAGTGPCQVCGFDISHQDFECGHVVAQSRGGRDTVDNLRPICRTCNRSMGADNLDDFKRQFFSQGDVSSDSEASSSP